MRRRIIRCVMGLSAGWGWETPLLQVQEMLPTIVLIRADDRGCFELGCYGQTRIKTPHID